MTGRAARTVGGAVGRAGLGLSWALALVCLALAAPVAGQSAPEEGVVPEVPAPPAEAVPAEAPPAEGSPSEALAPAPREPQAEPSPAGDELEPSAAPTPEPPPAVEEQPGPANDAAAAETPAAPEAPPDALASPEPPGIEVEPANAAAPRRSEPAASTTRDRHAKTVSGAELAKLGFFRDFEELDLESLLSPDVLEITTAVASGRDQAPESAPGSVTVLTGDDLRNLGVLRLRDALRMVAGLDVTIDGLGRGRIVARGVPTGAFAALSENVLFLLNGHRMNEDVTGGALALNFDMPVEGITKLEILRGPGSSLYGEGALAAVINIVTEEAGSFRGIRATGTAGSFGTYEGMVRVANEFLGVKAVGSMRLAGTSGDRPLIGADAQTLRDQAAGPGAAARSLAPRDARTGQHSLESLYHVSYGKLDAHWRVLQGTTQTFAGYANTVGEQGEMYGKQTLLDLRYRDKVAGLGSLAVQLSLTNNDQRDVFEALPPGFAGTLADGRPFRIDSGVFLQTRVKTARRGLEAKLDRDVGRDHQVSAGVVLEREATHDLEALSNLDFATLQPRETMQPLAGALADVARNSLGVYVQDVWARSSKLTLDGGARLDWLSDAGVRVSPRLAGVIRLPKDLSLKLLYGYSFRAPTFSELRFNLPGYASNPDLQPVVARTLEGSLGLRRANLRVSAGPFWNHVGGLILAERPVSALDHVPLVNGPDLDVLGLEAEGRAVVGLNTFFGSLTLQSPRFAQGGGRVPDLPTVMANLGATVAAGAREIVTVTWLLRSSSPRALGDTRGALSGYGVMNAQFQRERVVRGLDVSAALDNAFGVKYRDPAPSLTLPGDYPRPGRSVRLTVRYRF